MTMGYFTDLRKKIGAMNGHEKFGFALGVLFVSYFILMNLMMNLQMRRSILDACIKAGYEIVDLNGMKEISGSDRKSFGSLFAGCKEQAGDLAPMYDMSL